MARILKRLHSPGDAGIGSEPCSHRRARGAPGNLNFVVSGTQDQGGYTLLSTTRIKMVSGNLIRLGCALHRGELEQTLSMTGF